MKESGEGHIINLSSVFGLFSVPTQSAYNSAKFAVRGFTDALRMELELSDYGVSCTTVHPGGIKTNIARNARVDPTMNTGDEGGPTIGDMFDKIAMTTPEKAAREILSAVQHNRRRALIGPDAKVLDFLARLPAMVISNLEVQLYRRRKIF